MTREQAEAVLSEYLGVNQFIWLGKGVFNDETSGPHRQPRLLRRPPARCA